MALQDRPRAFSKDRPYEEAPDGTHAAVLVKVQDMGIQPNKFWKEGDPDWKKEKHDVRLAWVIDKPMADGRPFMVSQFMSLRVTLSRKAAMRSVLTKLAEMLLGKTIWEIDRDIDAKSEMDIANALRGHCALVTTTRGPTGRSKVSSVSPMPRTANGSPMLPLPDVGDMLDDVKVVQRAEPVCGPAEMDQVRAAAEKRAAELGGANIKDIIEWAKADLGVTMVNTMPISQVPALLSAVAKAEPPVAGANEEIPF